MKKLFLFAILLFTGMTFAQQYPLVTIQDIQFLPDSIIENGDAPSPLNGDTLRVRGVSLVSTVVDPVNDRRPIISAGARWVNYIEDQDGNVWGGINVIQHDTTGNNQNTFFDIVDSAQVVEFTGVVAEYFTTTQFELLLEPVTPVQVINQLDQRPEPIELQISDFINNGNYVNEAEKYEGMYVIIRNVISSDRNTSSGTFRINDSEGNYMTMYDQSGYFTLRGHRLTGLTDYEPPIDGTPINFIRGVINTRSDGYYIVPIYPGDISITETPPAISTVRRDPVKVSPGDNINITANIQDLDGSITDVSLHYRIDQGNLIEIPMSDQGNNIFGGTIPSLSSDSAIVDFYIKATDNDGNVAINPADTVNGRYFFPVLNRDLTIQDVQYSPYGSGLSGFYNYYVTVSGVVTADTSDIQGDGSNSPIKVYMQNGEGPWSGIWIAATGNLGNDVYQLEKGDNITITGRVQENFSVTRLDSVNQIVVNSSGNTLPAPSEVFTGTIDFLGSGNVPAEQWESVLIKYSNITITDTSADGSSNFGEILVDDGTGETRVELDDGTHSFGNGSNWNGDRPYQVSIGDEIDELRGILYYSFSNYKLVPRTDDDFIGYSNDVEEDNILPKEYSLEQNYPNPFNPSTIISYSLPKESNVKIKIYNLLGQEVKTLINKFQNAGSYKVTFDASNLTSGVYFYSIQADNFTEVKKMMLIK